MLAEIITIGDEILIGQIVDTNATWMAKALNTIGVSVHQVTTVQDDCTHIVKALSEAEKRVDIILLTGGLGPTKDDCTKEALTCYFKDELVLDEQVVSHIKALFAKIDYPFTALNRQQALLPRQCTPLYNALGTAPGMWFAADGKIVVSLPGVPYEMKALMKEQVLPKLQQSFSLPQLLHKTIHTQGIGESMLAERIEPWENQLPSFIKLAYLPSFGRVRLRLSASGSDQEFLRTAIDQQVSALQTLIFDHIVGYDESENLAFVVGRLLAESGRKLATAESCTGGALAKDLTSIPGASGYFLGGVVAYNAAVKIKELTVPQALIDAHSVVSVEVAEAMALGVQQKFGSDYALATTGNAGPTTDNNDKEVGRVCIAVATPKGLVSGGFFFGKPREKVIQRSVNKALEMLRMEILKNN